MKTGTAIVLTAVLVAGTGWNAASREQSTPSTGQGWMALDSTVVELRLGGDLIAAVHRTSGRIPRPGEDWVTVHDFDGNRVTRVVPSDAVPDARMFNVQEAAAANGVLIVSAYVGNDRDQHANLLLRYDVPSGELRRIVRIDPLVCWYLAVDADSIWCLGGNSAIFDRGSKDFDLLYRLSHNGEVLESALRWLHEFPEAGYPVTISKEGSPSLSLTDGGIRAWLPKAGRLVTWRPGAALRVTPVPPEILEVLRTSGHKASDVGTGLVVNVPDKSPSRSSGSDVLLVWRDSSAAIAPTGVTLSGDSLVVGARRDRLLLWDRRNQQIRWEHSPGLQ